MKNLKFNFKSIVQRKARWLITLIALLTLGVGQMMAGYNTKWKGNVFFRAPENWDLTTYKKVQVAISRSTDPNANTYQFFLSDMTRVGSTRLYYAWVSEVDHSGWNQNEYVFFCASPEGYGPGDFKVNSIPCYTTPVNYDFTDSERPYLYNSDSDNNGTTVTGSNTNTGADFAAKRTNLLVLAQTVNLYTNGSSSTTGGSVNIAGYYLTGNTTTESGNADNSTTSVSYNCAIGSTVTLTATPSTGYEFDGWYTAGTGGSLVSSSNPCTYTCTGAKTVYARFNAIKYDITLNKNGGSDDGSAKATYDNASLSDISAPTKTGYSVEGYYTSSNCTTKVATSAGALQKSITVDAVQWTDGSGLWKATAGKTFYANWTANQYTITFNPNGGSVTPTSASVTYDAAISNAPVPTKTGYNFTGYNTAGSASITSSTGAFKASVTGFTDASTHWIQADDATITAQWSAKSYTVMLDVDEANKGSIDGADESTSVTYDASPTTIANRPTAAEGYKLDGYYTLAAGEGTKVIDKDGKWISSATGYTDADGHWVHDGDVTLYAYYKKAEITAIEFTSAMVAPEATGVEAEITVSPAPEGTTMLCFYLLYNSGVTMESQPTFTYDGGTKKVTFTAPSASGSYKLQVILRTGSSCGGGTVLDTKTQSFTVAGDNTVTIKYLCGTTEVRASTTVTGKPLDWTEVTAPTDITGYTFSTWELGDGMTLKDGDALTNTTIHFKSSYDATLKAKYTKKDMIYFYNTLGWEDVWVYFYTSDKYWNATYGTGAWKGQYFTDSRPYWDMHRGHMTQIEGTNIWYFDYQAEGWSAWANVAFTNIGDQSGYDPSNNEANAPDNDHAYFSNTTSDPIEVVRRGDHTTALSMYVPYNGDSQLKNDNKAKYFFQGCWMNYPESTGYELYVFDSKSSTGDHGGSYYRKIEFELPADRAMPMTIKTDLEGGKTYGFKFVRHGSSDVWYGNANTMSNGHSGYGTQTAWEFKSSDVVSSDCGLLTSSAGEYEFSLTFGKDANSAYNYLVGVKFPESTGDYRVSYRDNNTPAGEWFVSHVIPHESLSDTVSFFVDPSASPVMKMEKCSVSWSGSATTVSWSDTIPAATNILSSVPSVITSGGKGVYYFCFNKNASTGKRELGDTKAYTGDFYIRTDCAPSNWDNFRSADHKMTYSEYAKDNNSSPAYTHYYMKYCGSGTNVKFVVANDYSPYISDTLNSGTHASDGTLDANANIRFMWDQRDNSLNRAYIAPAQNDGSKFLVMQGEADKIFDPSGNQLLDASGNNRSGGTDAIQFADRQDWVYEADVKATPGGRVKLYKTFDGGTDYIFGDADASCTGDHGVELIGGSGDATPQSIRVIYDFKTNRMMTAWVPADTVKAALTVNADIMILREHQEEATNIVLNGSGAISLGSGKTVYGIMRFNRYTLNNRSTAVGHAILDVDKQKSTYERSIYYISFPFDVKISEIFGFGEYGKEWVLERYRGDLRAKNGYWADSPTFWRFMGPDMTLKANEGYILALDLSHFAYGNTGDGQMWGNNVEEVELYFPAAETVSINQVADFEIPALDPEKYECTINRNNGAGGDRRVKDSYWRCIGVPSFADYSGTLSDGTNTIDWDNADLKYLYDINWADKTLTPYSGNSFKFQAMHSYLVQFSGAIHWANVYTKPASIVSRQREKAQEVEYRLEVRQGDVKKDQAYIRMSEDERVTAGFDFDQDMIKEFNEGLNLYTLIGYEPAAANSMPISENTTIVPVGVIVSQTGDYTFAIPEGTNGIGVTLFDNVTGVRTSLSAMDYTIELEEGTYDNRFTLEISPIKQTPTGVDEVIGDGLQVRGTRKVMIDGVLYIVKDGNMFDARGNRVQ